MNNFPVRILGRWLALLGVLGLGCDGYFPGQPKLSEKPVPSNRVLDFVTLYGQNCAGCHGAKGTLGPAPPLNDPLFRAAIPEQELLKVIRSGRLVSAGRKTPMPAFARENGGTLSEAQIQVLAFEILGKPYKIREIQDGDSTKVAIVRDPQGTSPHWGKPGSWPKTAPAYLTKTHGGDRERGARLFTQACASCHGKDGLDSKRKINDAAFLALISDQALRRLILTGRPDLGMPSYEGKMNRPQEFTPLTSQDIEDLVALLAYWRSGGNGTGQ